MWQWRFIQRLGLRAVMPALLVLHLVSVQAAMLSSVAPSGVEAPVAASAGHCHDAPAEEAPAPASSDHCDPGHCHCPIAMSHEPAMAAGPAAFIRRTATVLLLTEWPSLRQAPDTRPPIAT